MVSFDILIGIVGIVLAIVLIVLDKAGRLKGGMLYWLLSIAFGMTLFLMLGNSWVLSSPSRWQVWRGALMFCITAFAFSAAAIWIYPSKDAPPPEQKKDSESGKSVSSLPSNVIAATPQISVSTKDVGSRSIHQPALPQATVPEARSEEPQQPKVVQPYSPPALSTPLPSTPQTSVDTATAYAEVQTMIQRVKALEGDWQSAVGSVRQQFAMTLGPWKMGKRDEPMPSKWTDQMVQGLADRDQSLTIQYVSLESQIKKAREDALSRMKLTPNQANDDLSRFQTASRAALTPTPIVQLQANQPSMIRFSAMSNYLEDLLHRLGDCP